MWPLLLTKTCITRTYMLIYIYLSTKMSESLGTISEKKQEVNLCGIFQIPINYIFYWNTTESWCVTYPLVTNYLFTQNKNGQNGDSPELVFVGHTLLYDPNLSQMLLSRLLKGSAQSTIYRNNIHTYTHGFIYRHPCICGNSFSKVKKCGPISYVLWLFKLFILWR